MLLIFFTYCEIWFWIKKYILEVCTKLHFVLTNYFVLLRQICQKRCIKKWMISISLFKSIAYFLVNIMFLYHIRLIELTSKLNFFPLLKITGNVLEIFWPSLSRLFETPNIWTFTNYFGTYILIWKVYLTELNHISFDKLSTSNGQRTIGDVIWVKICHIISSPFIFVHRMHS